MLSGIGVFVVGAMFDVCVVGVLNPAGRRFSWDVDGFDGLWGLVFFDGVGVWSCLVSSVSGWGVVAVFFLGVIKYGEVV